MYRALLWAELSRTTQCPVVALLWTELSSPHNALWWPQTLGGRDRRIRNESLGCIVSVKPGWVGYMRTWVKMPKEKENRNS